MVTVTGFKTVLTDEGDTYVRLVLEGDLEMIKSDRTGNYYAHRKKASISSTFDEESAKSMIGQQISGSIIKQDVEAYLYELANGETIELKHRWVFTEETAEELAIKDLVSNANAFSNGNSKLQEVA